jgi:general secretion pathway protein A
VYTRFFGLNEKPFSITPDPRYLYMSRRHADALAHLLYGISESGGFIQLTGEVGTGKTTLVRGVLERLPKQADVAVVLNPQLTTMEFLQTICEELGVALPAQASAKALIDNLNSHLLKAHAQGRRTVVIVDEAQNLSTDVLEQVRMLTNLETAKQKLLQIILIGQPELRELLDRNDMRQLAQRITGRYHLEPLSRIETSSYIKHRLKVAGGLNNIFTEKANKEIYRLSGGVPRLVNVIADRALLAAYTRETRTVNPSLVRRAGAEVTGKKALDRRQLAGMGLLAAAGLALLAVGLWRAFNPSSFSPAVAALTATTMQPASILQPVFDQLELAADTDTAFKTLFQLWEVDYSPGDLPPCEWARDQGLACLFQQGSWAHLQRLNRPAILTLTDQQGAEFQAVLDSLRGDQASLLFGNRRYLVSLDELSNHWFGDHLVLWQPPDNAIRAITPGMRDTVVPWLRNSLAQIMGATVETEDPLVYDPPLETQVKDYQRARRLTVDGLVGARTQILIRTDLNQSNTPLLARAQ